VNEILLANYHSHLSAAKELAMYLPVGHPRRIAVERSMNEIATKLNLK
jgi:hypothetical protein